MLDVGLESYVGIGNVIKCYGIEFFVEFLKICEIWFFRGVV